MGGSNGKPSVTAPIYTAQAVGGSTGKPNVRTHTYTAQTVGGLNHTSTTGMSGNNTPFPLRSGNTLTTGGNLPRYTGPEISVEEVPNDDMNFNPWDSEISTGKDSRVMEVKHLE